MSNSESMHCINIHCQHHKCSKAVNKHRFSIKYNYLPDKILSSLAGSTLSASFQMN